MSNNTQSSGKPKKKGHHSDKEKLRQIVEEHKMWTDDKTFQEQEYERRRNEKKQRRGVLKNDKVLRRWRKSYSPAIIAIVVGCLLLLISTIDDVASGSVFVEHQRAFQVVGGVIVGLGIVSVMVTAACTYRQENIVRSRYGFPSLFEASRMGNTSGNVLHESFVLQNEFADTDSNLDQSFRGKFSRMTSYESSNNSNSHLAASFSSACTARTWVKKHTPRFQQSSAMFRRQNSSDTALDQSYARARLLAWRTDCGGDTDQKPSETNASKEISDPATIEENHPSVSQTYSISSTTSSGYHSSLSSPGVAQHNLFFNTVTQNPNTGEKLDHLLEQDREKCTELKPPENLALKIVMDHMHSSAGYENKEANGNFNVKIDNSKSDSHHLQPHVVLLVPDAYNSSHGFKDIHEKPMKSNCQISALYKASLTVPGD